MATVTVLTVVPSPTEDAEQLRKALAGWGTNEDLIVSILAHRSVAQRRSIRQAYADTNREDLLKDLDKELSSDFERCMPFGMPDPAKRDAYLVNKAMKRFTSSNWILMEIACTRSSPELLAIRQAYHAQYKKSLEEDVTAHIAGDFRKVPLASSFCYVGLEVNVALARSEAKILHEKISEKAYNHEEFIRILTTRRKAQLNATLSHYNDEFGYPVNQDLKADPNDEYLKVVRATIKCLTIPEKHFEKVFASGYRQVGDG